MNSLRHPPASRTLLAASLVLAGACSSSNPSVSLTSIGITPSDPSIAQGSTVQLTATGTYSDNSTQDVTSTASWTSSDPSKATVSSTGLVTGVAPGTVTVTASVGSVTGTVSVAVTAATLASIAVTPPNPSVAKGTTQQFTATGTYSDSTTQDITDQVAWSSSDVSKATVSDATGSKGLATTLAVGTTTISAALSGKTGSTLLTVTAATLESIAVTPPNPSIAKGSTQQFTATGTYSDSTTQDITDQVTWSSSDVSTATVSDAAGSKGLATTKAVGTTTISAALSGKTGSTGLMVTQATLASIAVTPTNPSLPANLTVSFTATGTFTDGSTQDLTTQVTWSSSNAAVASVSNATGSQGTVSTHTDGTATISATKGSVNGSTLLTVTTATLASIAVTPPNPSIANGTSQQFTATGTYSDGSTHDITDRVTWSSSSETVASISNAAGSRGLATAAGLGTTTISASFSGKTGSTLLTVTAATLVSIAVTPANPSLPRGLTQQFVATGTYTDGSTQVLTSSVSWSSSDASVASIANAGSPGLATALSVGSTTIKAVSGSVSGSTTLTVTSAILVSISVQPASVTMPQSSTRQFTALGTFSDSSVVDLTTQVTWTSSDATVVAISNAARSQGLATALAKGSVTITATKGAVTGQASASVP
jgi:uncharacterized protein YjdB